MNVRTQIAVLALAALAAARPAYAQEPAAGLTLSLDEAVTRALAASHRIEETRARSDASAAAVESRHASTLPQVTTIAGYTRTNHVDQFGILLPNGQLRVIYPDIPDNYRARLDVQYPLYTAGRLKAVEAAAKSEQSASRIDVDTTTADVRLDATRAFWSLVVARENESVVTESLRRMGEHLRDVRNQLDAGLLPPNDVLSTQAQEARQRMLSIQAKTTRELAEADLARLVGAPVGTSMVPAAALDTGITVRPFDALVMEAKEARPERRALLGRIDAARSRELAASAGRKPTVAVAGGVDYARPNPRIFPRVGEWRESWDAGVNVSWALFDGGRTKADVAEASAGVRALQARLAEFDSVVALEIRQRLSELESSQAAQAAADTAVLAATEARRVVGERFNAGVATSTDVVDAQVAILQASLDRTQALVSAQLAAARLNRALGQ